MPIGLKRRDIPAASGLGRFANRPYVVRRRNKTSDSGIKTGREAACTAVPFER